MSIGRLAGFIRNTAQDVKDLFALHFSPEAKSERVQRAYHLSSTQDWQDERGYQLSDRLWQQRRGVRKQIDQALREAIANGTDALVFADALEGYLVPGARPLRGIAGDLLPGQAKRIVTQTPSFANVKGRTRPDAGSYPARRLARTEISRAHAEATRWAAARTPGAIGIKWNLSSSHSALDRCNNNAEADNGLGPGVYTVGDFPTMPEHPCCLCFASQVVNPDVDAVIADLKREFLL